MEIVITIVCTLIFILTIIYFVSKRKFGYWKKKGVPHIKPLPIVGNYGQYIFLRSDIGNVIQKLCKKFQNEPYFGTYFGTEPALVVLNPEYLKLILTKDFYYFNSRANSKHNFKELVTKNLFFTQGNRWKMIRKSLSPLFSTLKMKNMFYLIEKCTHSLENTLDREITLSNVVKARPLMAKFTMDAIVSCAFGVAANTLEPDAESNPFTIIGQAIFSNSLKHSVKWVARNIWPGIFYSLGFKMYSTEISEFFFKLLNGVFDEREHKPSARNDLVDFVLNLKQKKYIVGDSLSPKTKENKEVKLEVDNDLLVGQCIVFFSAGFETSAGTLACTLYELAKNQEVQRKAQEEIDEYLSYYNNKLNYECILELPYLEACAYETLRMYPILPVITREVVENYTFPNGLKVEKDLRLHIPIYYFHHNPDYFPEPEKFIPERFLPGAKDEIKPFTFFPFGEGPRLCIGKKFAKMQVLSGLIAVLKKYNVEIAEETPAKIEFEAATIVAQTNSDLPLKFTPRSGWEKRVFTR